jgi:hypothetical protein
MERNLKQAHKNQGQDQTAIFSLFERKKKKEVKGIQIGKEESKVFTDDMII